MEMRMMSAAAAAAAAVSTSKPPTGGFNVRDLLDLPDNHRQPGESLSPNNATNWEINKPRITRLSFQFPV